MRNIKRKYYNIIDASGVSIAYACDSMGNDPFPFKITSPDPKVVVMENIKKTNTIGIEFCLKYLYYCPKARMHLTTEDLSKVEYKWANVQRNTFLWPIFSAQLREVIDANITSEETLTWLDAVIRCEDETRTYYIPKFTRDLSTLYNYNQIHLGKSDNCIDCEIATSRLVSPKIKKAIEEAKLELVDFS